MKKILLSVIAAISFSVQSQTTEITVTFTPGGANDTFARATQKYLNDRVGLQSVIVNRPGAEGKIGVKHAASQPADGSNLLVISTGTFLFSRVLSQHLDYDVHAFDTVVPVATSPIAIVVSNNSSITNWADFLAQAKQRPINCGISNTASRFVSSYIKKQLSLDNVELIPYKGGSDVAAAVLGNQIECAIEPQSTYMKHHRSHKLRIIATTDSETDLGVGLVRNSIPGFVFQTWYGLGILKNTPESIKGPILSAMREVHRDPQFLEYMTLSDLAVRPPGAISGNQFLDRQYQFWETARQNLNIPKQ